MSRIVAMFTSIVALVNYAVFLMGGVPIENVVAFDITAIAIYVVYIEAEVKNREN